MGSTFRRMLAAVLTALFVIALAACSGNTSDPAPTASSVPTISAASVSTPVEIFEQTGSTAPLVKQDGKYVCGPDDGSTTLKLDGTVDYNGEQITGNNGDNDVVTVTFSPENADKETGIVNGSIPFIVPMGEDETPADWLLFNQKNFGPITTIVLCGGGL